MIDPQDSKTIGYHLFLEPENSLRGELQEIITKLADENHAPGFPPHVTLLARIPDEPLETLQEKARKLAGMLSPLELTLAELGAEEKYFKALYAEIKEQDAIAAYHQKANEFFGMQDEGAYAAHLSLLYGNYEPEDIAHIRANLVYPKGVSFTVRKIHLYKTDGEASNWKKVAEFPMQANTA